MCLGLIIGVRIYASQIETDHMQGHAVVQNFRRSFSPPISLVFYAYSICRMHTCTGGAMNKHISDRNSYSHIDLRCKFISMTFGRNFYHRLARHDAHNKCNGTKTSSIACSVAI